MLSKIKQAPKLPAFILFCFTLPPRLLAINRYVTPDELTWVHFSIRLREALLARDWAHTIQIGHPGLTTSWLAMLGIQLKLWLVPSTYENLIWINQLYWLSPDNSEAHRQLAIFLTPARLSIILINTLGILLIYHLAQPHLGQLPAFCGALLLALDPFIAGLSGILHLDALLSTLILLTLLLALPHPHQPYTTKRAILIGILTGLTILTKLPGIILLPLIPFLWLITNPNKRWFTLCFWWAISILITINLLLPAIWADPHYLWQVIHQSSTLEASLSPLSFFKGQLVHQPDASFYPLVILFRLSPLALIGLSIYIYQTLKVLKTFRVSVFTIITILFTILFVLGLSLSTRKFDRYLLPVLMLLTLISGCGIVYLLQHYQTYQRQLAGIFLTLSLAFLIAHYQAPMTAFNWLLGGLPIAQHIFPIGWGEGASAAAQLANQYPTTSTHILYTNNIPATAPFFAGNILPLTDAKRWGTNSSDYWIETITDRQTNPPQWPMDQSHTTQTIQLAGIPQAWLTTQRSPSTASPPHNIEKTFHFDHQVTLLNTTVLPTYHPDQLSVWLTWQASQPAPYQLQIALQDQDQHIWLQQELPLLNGFDHPATTWPTNTPQPPTRYDLSLPPDLPPANYQLRLALFDAHGNQLATFHNQQFAGITASLSPISITPASQQPPLTIPFPLTPTTGLVGYDQWTNPIGTGETLTLDLWWQHTPTTPNPLQFNLILSPQTPLPSQPFTTTTWATGQTLHLRPTWRIPPNTPAGTYPLTIQAPHTNPITLGQLHIETRPRTYTLPPDLIPAQIQFPPLATLQQAQATIQDNTLTLHLIWQANNLTPTNYLLFLHVRDAQNNILTQIDRSPRLPTNQWVTDQIITDTLTLPLDDLPLTNLALGLYDPQTGQRLPIYDPLGNPQPNHQWIIPLSTP